jgi:hypothetical protein
MLPGALAAASHVLGGPPDAQRLGGSSGDPGGHQVHLWQETGSPAGLAVLGAGTWCGSESELVLESCAWPGRFYGVWYGSSVGASVMQHQRVYQRSTRGDNTRGANLEQHRSGNWRQSGARGC